MDIKKSCRVRGQSLAALSFTFVLAAAGVAGATTVRTSATPISIPSIRQMGSAGHSLWSLGGGVVHSDAKAAGYSAYLHRLRFSAGKTRRRSNGCTDCTWRGNNIASAVALALPSSPAAATLTSFALPTPPLRNFILSPADASGVLVADLVLVSTGDPTPVRVAGTSIPGLQGGLIWRSSSFSIAGSRVWSKLIKFTSRGINVRVPLN